MKKLIIVLFGLLFLIGCKQQSSPKYFLTDDGRLEVLFPAGWFQNTKDNPYNLQCFSKDRLMTSGVFVYLKEDMAEGMNTPRSIFDFQVQDLRSKRKNFKIQEKEKSYTVDNKTITTAVYAGEKNKSRFYYKFSLIEFKENPDRIVVVAQVSFPSEWAENKPILKGIIDSAVLKNEAEE